MLFSTSRFLGSNKFAACVPVLVCQDGEKVMDYWIKVKYIISCFYTLIDQKASASLAETPAKYLVLS